MTTHKSKQFLLFEIDFACINMSVSINGVYKNYDHMHVAFPRIIPANHTTNHTHESYYESYP